MLVAHVILLLALKFILRHHLLPKDGLGVVIQPAAEARVAVHVPRVVAFFFFFLVWLLVFVADLATGHASRDDCGADL